jgi:hypothetical protein
MSFASSVLFAVKFFFFTAKGAKQKLGQFVPVYSMPENRMEMPKKTLTHPITVFLPTSRLSFFRLVV